MTTHLPDISFVILTWNSSRTIGECLAGVTRQCVLEDLKYEILVADNGSKDETRDIVKAHAQDHPVRLIRFSRNMGAAVSRNAALHNCRAPAICVMDSDAVFKKGRIRSMLSLLDDPSLGIAAPRLVLSDGTVQNSVKRHPSVPAKLLKIPRIVFGVPTPNLDFYPDFPFEAERDVETAIAACWFFRTDLLDRVGLLDERFFFPTEDVDYCLRVRKAGFRILYAPYLTVLHYTQHYTHKNPLSRMSLIHFRNVAYYFWKHRYVLRPDLKPERPGWRPEHKMCTALPPLPGTHQTHS